MVMVLLLLDLIKFERYETKLLLSLCLIKYNSCSFQHRLLFCFLAARLPNMKEVIKLRHKALLCAYISAKSCQLFSV